MITTVIELLCLALRGVLGGFLLLLFAASGRYLWEFGAKNDLERWFFRSGASSFSGWVGVFIVLVAIGHTTKMLFPPKYTASDIVMAIEGLDADEKKLIFAEPEALVDLITDYLYEAREDARITDY